MRIFFLATELWFYGKSLIVLMVDISKMLVSEHSTLTVHWRMLRGIYALSFIASWNAVGRESFQYR